VDLSDPKTGPSIVPLSRWRRLPLSAQLAAIGMLVALAWFLTARMAADRVQEAARERNAEIDRLNQGELTAARLLTSISQMSAAQRGFILTGAEELVQRYEIAYRTFNTDAASLGILAGGDRQVLASVEALTALVAEWDRTVVAPNITARRRAGYAAFSPGTAGGARVREGTEFFDEMRAQHANILRSIRRDAIELQAEAERAAAVDEWDAFLLRAAAVAIFLLLLSLIMRVVARALNQVVGAAEALDAGRYEAARLPYAHRAPNAEIGRLAHTFDRLAQSIATRERQLQDDIEKLKELEALKADFVSTVSHELRTPLTSMRGALGLLLGGAGGELAPKGRELLRIALTNTDRLIRLINDILDIEKMDAGHVAIRRDRLRLRSVLEATTNGLEGLSKDTGVRIEITDVADLEIIGDSDRLIQVFTNLISNAVKFSPRDQPVELSARVERGAVKVCVRDHGPGIPPEFASRIFGRFQQAGGADSRRSGGTGLGLSIAKAITELHGGQIGFQNAAEGTGTIFGVVLPIAPPSNDTEDARASVLIVEDDDSMRDVLTALIEPFAHPVPVPDAAAAMRALGRQRVQVVILDHGLPGMDGLAFARRLRADPRFRALPILLYSANEFSAQDLKDSGIRISDAFVKTRDYESSLVDRVKRELQGGG
jgi:signal transduction histidine kinase/CheY-like chemotaxis protein